MGDTEGGGSVTAIVDPQNQVGRGGQLSSDFFLAQAGGCGKTGVYQEAIGVFYEDVADRARAVLSIGIRQRRYAAKFPIPREPGQVLLPEVQLMIEWLHKADVTMTGVAC